MVTVVIGMYGKRFSAKNCKWKKTGLRKIELEIVLRS